MIRRMMFTAGVCVMAALPAAAETHIVRHDRGGSVAERFHEVKAMMLDGTRVEVRGTCLSSCTMYLRLGDNVCTAPDAIWGFHGPSMSGKRLPPKEHEKWAQFIADHYPAVLRSYYLEHWQGRTFRQHRVSGAEMVRIGAVQLCPSAWVEIE